ncbi:MAG: hypothetical protein AMXMBFR46_16950 [Acidimicrobiia bacterium]
MIRADEFDVARAPNRHLAFGFGAHCCLGTHLARLEMRSLFDARVARLRSVELAGHPRTRRRCSWADRSTCPSATSCAEAGDADGVVPGDGTGLRRAARVAGTGEC